MVDFSDYPHQSTFSRHLQKFNVPTAKKIGGVNVGFIGETRDFLWGRFHPGNRYSGQEAKGFLRECLKILPQRVKNIRARGDSSFFHGAFLEEMEKQGIEYALAAKLYAPSQYLLGGLDYRDIGDGIAVGEFGYHNRNQHRGVAA